MRKSKRIVDVLMAIFGSILCLPFFLIIAIAIKLDDGGPIFFRQERIGHLGGKFDILKFRSMGRDAALGGLLTVGNDARITRVGRILRRWKLDELPQFINVLVGQMSLVGPRPEVEKYVAFYNDEQRKVLDLVPGITDPASIEYRDESRLLSESSSPEKLYIEKIMPDKIRINLKYAQHSTLRSDIKVLFLTVFKILI